MSKPTVAERERFNVLLLDTHVLVWLISGDPKLGLKARSAIDLATQQDNVMISAITPWEIGLLVAKKRVELHRDPLEWVRAVLAKPGTRLVPLDPEIAVGSTRLPFDMHSDPADRILVATARHLGAVLVTADGLLLELAKKRHITALNAEK
jgi:PIN domain nuclease of toxin-antitoxin system